MLAYNLELLADAWGSTASRSPMPLHCVITRRWPPRGYGLLFVAAKIWRHAGRTRVSFGDHYEEKGVFNRLMDWLALDRRVPPRTAAMRR